MIEVRCLQHLVQAEPFRHAINAVNLASARPDPFSTFEFYENHLRSTQQAPAGENMRLWLLLAFDQGELVGYMMLRQSTHRVLGLRAVRLDMLTSHDVDRPHLVTRPEYARAVGTAMYTYLLHRKQEWSLLEFQQQDADSALMTAPTAASSGRYRMRSWPNLTCWSIPLHSQSIAGYFASLPNKARSNVSRQMRSLMAAGDVQVLTSSDPQTVVDLFALYQCVERHSWKAQAGPDLNVGLRSPDYFRGLMDAAQPMRIVITILLLDGMPIAGLICGSFGKGLHALNTAYDNRFAGLAPGSAILLLGVRLAIEGGFEFFDLLRGFGYYKSRWLANMTETKSVQIYRVGTPYFWRRVVGDLGRSWHSKATTVGDILFNPTRRKLATARPASARDAPMAITGSQEHADAKVLVAKVLCGCGEFISAAQLAELLPFVTRPCNNVVDKLAPRVTKHPSRTAEQKQGYHSDCR